MLVTLNEVLQETLAPIRERRKELEELKDNEYTIIFYEAPHRIIKTLELMKEIFGDREISISREITKKFETVYRGKFSEVISNIPDKGEFVIVVAGKNLKERNKDNDEDNAEEYEQE